MLWIVVIENKFVITRDSTGFSTLSHTEQNNIASIIKNIRLDYCTS